MIIAIFLMLLILIFVRDTWLLAEYLEAEAQSDRRQIADEQSLESNRALLERCLYRAIMTENYES